MPASAINRRYDLMSGAPAIIPYQLNATRGESRAHTWRVTLTDGGAPANLSGYSATCYAIYGGVTTAIPATISGNVVSATLTQDAYDMEGMHTAQMWIANPAEGDVHNIDRMTISVIPGLTDDVSDPKALVPSLPLLLAQYDQINDLLVEYYAAVEADAVPSYFAAEVAATEAALAQYYSPANLRYLMLTDPHNDSDARLELMRKQVNVVRHFANKYAVDFICLGGDLITDTPFSRQLAAIRLFEGINCPVYAMNGNHDALLPKNEWGFYIASPYAKGSAHFSGLSRYFYADVPGKNFRAIFLDSTELPDGVTDNYAYWGYSAEQINWLIDVLANTPDAVNVVLFSHIPHKPAFNLLSALPTIFAPSVDKIIRAFNAHGSDSWTDEGVAFSCDFTGKANKIVLEHFGHKHIDLLTNSSAEPIVYVSTASACYNITVTNAAVDSLRTASGVADWEYNPTKTAGTATEALFDVITVGGGTVRRTRFGGGTDKVVSY